MVLVYPFLFSNETVKNSLNFGAKALQNHRSKRPGTKPKLILWLKTVIERTMRQIFLSDHLYCTLIKFPNLGVAWFFQKKFRIMKNALNEKVWYFYMKLNHIFFSVPLDNIRVPGYHIRDPRVPRCTHIFVFHQQFNV